MAKHEDHFDEAIHAYLSGEAPHDPVLEPFSGVFQTLELIRDVPDRTAGQHATGRETFLEQARSLSPPVSKERYSRLKGWKKILRRERFSMTSIMGIILAVVIAFGGFGTAAVAAQDSLPTEPLYAIKQLTEQLRFGLTTDHQEKANLLMNFVAVRVREMGGLIEQGDSIPRQTALRLENHLQLALQAAAQLEDAEMIRTLTRLHQRTQAHIQTMEKLQQHSPNEEGLQLATRAMLQAQRAAEDGLEDPVTFRNRQGTNRPEEAPEQPEIIPPGGESRGEDNGLGPEGGSEGQGQGAPGHGGNGQDQGEGDGSSGNNDGSWDGSDNGGQDDPGGSESSPGERSGEGTDSGSNGQGGGSGSNGGSGKGN
jgi:uncharacterized membrane protein YgcG